MSKSPRDGHSRSRARLPASTHARPTGAPVSPFPNIIEWAGATRNRARFRHCRWPVALLKEASMCLRFGSHTVEVIYAEIHSSREIPASFKMVFMRLTSTSSP
jgi:hypothetical protein